MKLYATLMTLVAGVCFGFACVFMHFALERDERFKVMRGELEKTGHALEAMEVERDFFKAEITKRQGPAPKVVDIACELEMARWVARVEGFMEVAPGTLGRNRVSGKKLSDHQTRELYLATDMYPHPECGK